MIKNLLNSFLIFFLSIIISTILITLIDYFSLFNTSILKLVIPILITFISSFILGTKSNKLGYVEGLKFGGIIIGMFLLLTIILDKFYVKSLIYYLILLLTSVLSSMIGINKKKTN